MESDALLQEYDDTIQKQAALLKRQQVAIEDLRGELSTVHGRLISSEKLYQSKLEALAQQVHSTAIQDRTEDDSLLKQELDTALKEKEMCQAENKRQSLEIQRLRQEASLKQPLSGEIAQIPSNQLQEYERVTQALEEETQRLRSKMAKTEDEKMEVLTQNVNLKKRISSLEFKLEEDGKEINILRSTDQEKDKSSLEMKESFTNLNKQFADQSEDLRILLRQTNALQKTKDHLTAVLTSVNERLEDARIRVFESVRIAEDAIVEKDAALLREKHALSEVSRLESTISLLTEEAGEKTQAEILKIKDGYNSSIRKVSQEVVSLEIALNKKQHEFTKVVKDKDKILSKLEQVEAELGSKKDQHQEELLNLHQRIASQENRIKALMTENDSFSATNARTLQDCKEQRESFLQRVQELENHLMASHSDCESLRVQHENLKREYHTLIKEFNRAEEERKSNEKSIKRQLRLKSEELEELTSSSSIRLDAVDSSHKKVIKQLTENINVLQESYSRLQTQMEKQKKDYEERVTEVSQRLQDTTARYKSASQTTHEVKTELAVTKDMATQYKNRIEELESRLRAAEQRYGTLKRGSANAF